MQHIMNGVVTGAALFNIAMAGYRGDFVTGFIWGIIFVLSVLTEFGVLR